MSSIEIQKNIVSNVSSRTQNDNNFVAVWMCHALQVFDMLYNINVTRRNIEKNLKLCFGCLIHSVLKNSEN